ncbi:MAG: HIT family protein [Gammaproteobacteria bacterium]|nr:MAG: HIT family protein [Gammaproteobacteria bacterium]
MTFILDPQLQLDTVKVGNFPLCTLLLHKDKTFPWFILVPQIADIKEIYQLDTKQQNQFIKESSLVSVTLNDLFSADKLNIAALGNVVAQLHIHHIVRYKTDPAWPAPIWGQQKEIFYSQLEITALNDKFNLRLSEHCQEYTPN